MNQWRLRLDHQLQCMSALLYCWSIMTFHVKIWFHVWLIQQMQCVDAMQVFRYCSKTEKCHIWSTLVEVSVITSITSARISVVISTTQWSGWWVTCREITNSIRISGSTSGIFALSCWQIPYQTLRKWAGHRWLSVRDVAQGNLAMFDAFTVLYAAWLTKDVKSSHMNVANQLVASVSSAGQMRIVEIRKACEKWVWSKDGRSRKQRITEKIFMQRDQTLCLLHMYCSILPIFKSATLTFEQKVPMVHRIHDDDIDVTKKFLSPFLCPEKITDLSASVLKTLNVHDEAVQRPLGDIFIGKEADNIVSKWQQKVSTPTELMKTHMANIPVTQCEPENACRAFRKMFRKANADTGAYLLGKLPLENKVLRRLSATDPRALGHPAAGKALWKLGAQFPTVALNQDAFTVECM